MDAKLVLVLVAMTYVQAKRFRLYGHDYDRTPLGDSIDKSSMKLLQATYLNAGDKNVVTSPLGVMLLLSLYSAGTSGASQEEISRFLGATDGDYKKLTESYSELSGRLAAMDPSYFTLANKIYVSNNYQLDGNFSNVARSYDSEADVLDFSNPQAAADVINQWAKEKTQGHIPSPVSADALDPAIAAALFNVIFFQGHWHVPFEAKNTVEKDFHVDENTIVKKPTMHLKQSLLYHDSKDLRAKLVELPYKETNYRMVIVLPDEKFGLSDVLKKVAQRGLLEDVFSLAPAGRDVELELPKFDIKTKLDLNNLLPEVGVSKIFSDPAPGVVRGTAVKVAKAFQEAFVKIDEEGATAGAFTGLIAVPMSSFSQPPEPMKYKVDHPFIYLILHEDKIIFTGTYTH